MFSAFTYGEIIAYIIPSDSVENYKADPLTRQNAVDRFVSASFQWLLCGVTQ